MTLSTITLQLARSALGLRFAQNERALDRLRNQRGTNRATEHAIERREETGGDLEMALDELDTELAARRKHHPRVHEEAR